MKKRVDPETVLHQEHAARQVQRAGPFLLNLVLAALVLAGTIVPQVLAQQFYLWLTVPGAVLTLAILLSLRIALQWDRAVVLRLGRFQALKGPGVFWLVV